MTDVEFRASRARALRATHRDRNPLEAMPDPDNELPMRRPRDTGTTPAQIQDRLQAAIDGRMAQ